MSSTNVPVGVTSVAGYTVTVSTFAAAVVAYLSGDHSQGNLIVIALGIFSAVSFVVTQAGRYAQAHAQAKKPTPAPTVSPSVWSSSGSTGSVTFTGSGNTFSPPAPTDDLDPEPPEGPDPTAARSALDKTS